MKSLRNTLFALFLSVLPLVGFAASVDVNRADAPALAAGIDGVGPHLAEAIVQYRKAHGPFTSLEQLLQVKGIGPHVLERNHDRLTVGRRGEHPQPK